MALKLSTDDGSSRARLPTVAPAARRPPKLTVLGRPMLTMGRRPGRKYVQRISITVHRKRTVRGYAQGSERFQDQERNLRRLCPLRPHLSEHST